MNKWNSPDWASSNLRQINGIATNGQLMARRAGPLAEGDDPVHGDLTPCFTAACGPTNLDAVNQGGFSQPEMDPRIVRREITAVASNPALYRGPVLVEKLDHASVPGPVGSNPFRMHDDPVPPVRGRVQQQPRRPVIVRDQNVDSAVIVYIA